MMKIISGKYLPYSILFILFIVFTVVVFSTQNSFGGGDHFTHFSLAYWGWKYPDMLFSHWGKPVFTLLVSPFAQFGINGARIYNVIVGLLTAYFTWRIAQHLKLNHAWAVLFFVLFTPVYFILLFTSLTEVTFSFFLVLAIFLFFKEKYIWSAIILSFIPLIRNEGIVLFPLLIAAYSLKRQFIALPFLSVGFLIIGFMGWPYYDSFWWLITEMPYSGSAKDIYGSGSLFHFLSYYDEILGAALGLLFIWGTLITAYLWTASDKFKLTSNFYFLMLIAGAFIVFFAAHSYVWWKGTGNSLGLIRVIGSVTPLAALTALAGFSFIFQLNKRYLSIAGFILMLALIPWLVIDGVQKHKYGFYLSYPQLLIKESANYIKEHGLDKHKIYYYDNFLAHQLNFDPRNREKNQIFLPRNENFLSAVPDSSIIVWDAHFGPNEGRMPLERLANSKELVILKTIKPEINFKVLGGYDYQIVIFQKITSHKPKVRQIKIDYENDNLGNTEKAYKGSKSFKLESDKNYQTLLEIIYQEISDTLSPAKINVKVAYNLPAEIESDKLLLVCTLHSDEDVIIYETADLWTENTSANVWHEKSFHFDLPVPNTVNDLIKIYLWNNGGVNVYIDEVNIEMTPAIRDHQPNAH